MKNAVITVLAGAVLATAGLAQASNSVTLYGVGDAWVGSKPGKIDLTKLKASDMRLSSGATYRRLTIPVNRQAVVESGGLSGSRWGVLVKEDLGSGLKAFVNFEQGIKLDTGAESMRKSVIGIGSSSWGTLTAGYQYSAYDDAFGLISAQGNDSFDAASGSTGNYAAHYDDGFVSNLRTEISAAAARDGVVLTPGDMKYLVPAVRLKAAGAGRVGAWVGYNTRYANSLRYDSPNFSGVSGAIIVGVDEDRKKGLKASHNISMHVKYLNGPMALAFAHQIDRSNITRSGKLLNVKQKNTLIGGSYDFGSVKAHLGLNFVGGTDVVKAKEFLLGATVPLANKYKLIGQLAHSKMDSGMKTMSFGLEGHYSLSKRTTAYAAWNHTNTKLTINKQKADVKASTYGLGMRHKF